MEGLNEEIENTIHAEDSTVHYLLVQSYQTIKSPCKWTPVLFRITFEGEPHIIMAAVWFASTQTWKLLAPELEEKTTLHLIGLPCVDFRGDLAVSVILYFNAKKNVSIEKLLRPQK